MSLIKLSQYEVRGRYKDSDGNFKSMFVAYFNNDNKAENPISRAYRLDSVQNWIMTFTKPFNVLSIRKIQTFKRDNEKSWRGH